jgi:uncharacterized protein (UPF0147 family)
MVEFNPKVEISLKDTDIFKEFIKIVQEVLEDGRVPVDVKHKIRDRVKELTDKEDEK